MTEMYPNLPDPLRATSFREWLSAVYLHLKTIEPGMNQRKFAALCGYQSSGAIALINSGQRGVSEDAARRLARALGLDPSEREHLVLLVRFENTGEFEDKSRFLDRLAASRRYAAEWSGTIREHAFYSAWFIPVVRELVSTPDFREDASWIAARVLPPITVSEAEHALATLLECGYLVRDASGRLQPAQPLIATNSEAVSDALVFHQREMMTRAAEAIENQAPELRDMRVMTVAISRSQAEQIKARISEFHREIFAIVAKDEPIEGVYQLNTQWFSVAAPVAAAGATK